MNDAVFSMSAASKRSALQSDVVIAGNLAFISGLGPIDLRDDRVSLPEYVEAQIAKIFANLEELLAGAGLSKEQIVSVRISLIDYGRLYERMNVAYRDYFSSGRLPVRSCVGVSELTRGASVEMDFVLSTGTGRA
jgi:enamine deaminase RidA (YjgF/YER057c/UK114 family)